MINLHEIMGRKVWADRDRTKDPWSFRIYHIYTNYIMYGVNNSAFDQARLHDLSIFFYSQAIETSDSLNFNSLISQPKDINSRFCKERSYAITPLLR